MPLYEYACSACDHRVDILLGLNDPGPHFCPSCGEEGTMRKLFAPPTIHFKGSGWAKKDRGAASASRSSSSKGEGSSGDGSSAGGSSAGGSSAGTGSAAASDAAPASGSSAKGASSESTTSRGEGKSDPSKPASSGSGGD
jgi:putative FmdB family regulatory protein